MNPPPPAQQEMILTTTPDGTDEIRSKTFVVFLKTECSCVGARGGGRRAIRINNPRSKGKHEYGRGWMTSSQNLTSQRKNLNNITKIFLIRITSQE